MRGVFTDLTGQKFNRLTVVGLDKTVKKQGAHWCCVCDCGTVLLKSVDTNRLIHGKTKSCGCLMIERVKQANTTHGMTLTPTYIVWRVMWARTANKKHKSYQRYKKFVPVDRWKSFENFLADMGERPSGMTLDRIDNSRGYSPDNCRWADAYTQQANTKKNIYVLLDGEKLCLKEACRRTGMPYGRAKNRVRSGWSPLDAVTKPKTNKWNNTSKTKLDEL